MRKLLGFGLLIGIVVFIVVAASGNANRQTAATTTTSSSSSGPGAASVYAEIAAERDCARLQAMFDTATANHDRETSRHDLTLMLVTSSYMSAVYDRQDELGCL